MYTICVDYRERDFVSELNERGVSNKIETENLELGDILVKDESGKTVIIIERKEIKDYVSSISDKRSKEQRIRLLSNYKGRSMIVYLVEGFSFRIPTDSIFKRSVSKDSVLSSIVHLQLRDQVTVYHTRNIKESVDWLLKVVKKLEVYPIKFHFDRGSIGSETEQKKPESLEQEERTDYINSLRFQHKKNHNKVSNIYLLQLLTVPRMSLELAEAVEKEFPSMFKLIEGYNKLETEEKKEKMLMDIKNKSGRRLGKVLSKNIYISFKN